MTDQKTSYAIRVILLFSLLYLFLLSIGLLGSSLKMFGKGFAEALIATTSHPIIGLFIGILVTSIVQSSSMTTSLVVGLVGGGMLSVESAIPMIMGANIGTTITNAMVSLVHLGRTAEFRRAFAAATVHDIFNIMAVMLFLPLQIMTNFLGHSSEYLAGLFSEMGGLKLFNPLKVATEPIISSILEFVKQSDLLNLLVATNILTPAEKYFVSNQINIAAIACTFIAIVFLFLSLTYMVKVLKSVFIGRLTRLFQRYIFKTMIRSFIVGLLITVLVQSSSITTSLIVPLAGSGVLSLMQVFPYTLGANLGTTATAMLAALATGSQAGVAIALAHMLFNIFGIAIFFPMRKVPVMLAQKLADQATKSKMIPIAFIGIFFFVIPLLLISIWR